MDYDKLIEEAKNYAEKNYFSKPSLGQDEELQLISCGYSVLFLSARANKSTEELGLAHEFIARCFKKTGDLNYAEKHLKSAAGYKS